MSLALTGETLDQLRTIVWGKNPREDVFQRWTQGIPCRVPGLVIV